MPRPRASLVRAAITALWLTGALYAVWSRSSTSDGESPGLAAVARRDRGDLDGAVAVLQRADILNGRDPQLLELLGGLERERGRLAEAADAFRAARALAPQRPEAVLGLADVLLRQGAVRPAGETLESLDDQALDTSQRRRWLSLAAETGDVGLLTRVTARALQRDPGDVEALTRAVDAAEQRHDWPQAASLAGQLMVLAPALRETAALRAAHAFEAAGALAEAFAAYRQTDETRTWLAQARLASALGDVRRAADLWQRYPDDALTPADREARAYSLHQAGQVRDAERAYQALWRTGALSDTGRVRYAWLLNTRHRYDEAWTIAGGLPDTRATLEVRAYTAAWARKDAASTLLTRWLTAAPGDRTAWMMLADVLGRRGDAEGRTAVLRRLNLEEAPPPVTPAERARQFAAAGEIDRAAALYRTALAQMPGSDPARPLLGLELGRLLRWNGRTSEAVGVLRQALPSEPAAPALAPAQVATVHNELARALAESAQWRDARASADLAYRIDGDTDLLVLAAQASTALAQPADAAGYLEQLAHRRPLSDDELRWLAGQSEEAGLLERALTHYRSLAGRAGDNSDAIWEHIGDLEDRRGERRAALDAYQHVPVPQRTPMLWARLTHVAASVGDHVAAVTYEEAHRAQALDAAGYLSAARHHAAGGRPDDAIAWYERYLAVARDPAGLHLELTRAHLAAGRPTEALRWARAGREAGGGSDGGDDPDLMLAEGQALHLLGRSREAARLLGRLVDDHAAGGDLFAWLARTAQARGRRVDAYTLFGQALARGARPAGEFLLARGDLAAAGGDVGRAVRDYAAAEEAGEVEQARLRQRALMAQQRPAVLLPVERFSDTTGFESVSAGGGVALWPRTAARVTALWSTGRISQRAVGFDRSAVTAQVDRLYPTERTAVTASLGVEAAGDSTHPLWRAEARYQFRSRGSVTATTFRETPWTAESNVARERYNRIADLAGIPHSFHTTGLKVGAAVPVFEHEELQGHAAVRAFNDGNRQAEAFLQFQAPVVNRPRAWVAVQPYGYVEQWARTDPRYFSPAHQVTLAVAGRAILSASGWTLDLSAAPQWLTSDTRTGPGYSAVTSVRRTMGAGSLGASWMTFEDRQQRYRLNRFTVDATIAIR